MVDLTGQRMKWRSYEHLYNALQALRAFFSADGEGLNNDDLETQEYKVVIFHAAFHSPNVLYKDKCLVKGTILKIKNKKHLKIRS